MARDLLLLKFTLVIPGRSPLGERTRNPEPYDDAAGFRVRAEEARPGMTNNNLRGGSAAVDGIGGACDIACLVGSKKRHHGGDLGGKPQPPRRNPLDDLLVGYRRV